VKCGSASFKLTGAPRADFPELPESKSVPIKIPSVVMAAGVKRNREKKFDAVRNESGKIGNKVGN